MKIIVSERQFGLLSEQKKTPSYLRPIKPATSSSTYVRKNPVIQNSDISLNKRCRSQYNQKTLSEAIQWWVDWLKNPNTLNKFASNWGITKQEASKVFEKYFEFLKDLKLSYVFENTNNYARVRFKRGEVIFHHPNKTIYVNCSMNNEDPLGTLIHEIQHGLFVIKSLHPEQKIETDIKFDLNDKDSIWERIKSLFGTEKKFSMQPQKNLILKLKKDGIISPEKIITRYNRTGKGYLEDETEVLSRLSNIRANLKLKPGQDIKLQDFIDLVNSDDNGANWLMFNIIHKGISIQEMLNKLNQYAKTNTILPVDVSKNKEYNV
jgi:hypothetical protein